MESRRKGSRLKKRGVANRPDHDPSSAQLRQAGDAVRRHQYAQALSTLNSLAATVQEGPTMGKLLSMVGDVYLSQGQSKQAQSAYKDAQIHSVSDPVAWFRPVMGEIVSLLKDVQVDAAAGIARTAVANAKSREDVRRAHVVQSQQQLASVGVAKLKLFYMRPSVVATKLGSLFLREGEISLAKEMFNNALDANPSGGCRARLGLAEIALRERDPATASSLAKSALVVGKYQAKTISAWKLLISANIHLGSPPLDFTLLPSLQQARPNVRARSMLAIITTLRGLNDPNWRDLANGWLSKESAQCASTTAALRQMFVADAKRSAGNDKQILSDTASALLSTESISLSEWLVGTKQLLRTTDPKSLVSALYEALYQGINKFGSGSEAKITYNLARSASHAHQHNEAKHLLGRAVQLDHTRVFWRKAATYLASLESKDENYAAAANWHLMCAQDESTPMRIRFNSHIRWAKCLIKAGNLDAILAAKTQLLNLVNASQDYETMLDLAHAVIDAPRELNHLAKTMLSQGQSLALQGLEQARSPASASTILMKLARRYADFGMHSETIATWTALSSDKKAWLWSANADYWDYVGLVFRAYRDGGDTASAMSFITPFLNDSATPLENNAMLYSLYGIELMNEGNVNSGTEALKKGISLQPTCKYCAYGYYWLALSAHAKGTSSERSTYANRVLTTLGNHPSMQWQSDLALSAKCILANLDTDVVAASENIPKSTLSKLLSRIQTDLRRLV